MRQKDLIEKLNGRMSQQFISLILTGKRRPKWKKAKLLAMVTGTSAEFWMEASPDQMRKTIEGLPGPGDTASGAP